MRRTLEVRLLGPLEVADGERILTPHRRKPRSLLAVLALRAGRPVPKDVLVDLVWGEDAPRRAVDALENYISQLRKALGRDMIATEPAGYRLTLPPEQVDVSRFESLVGGTRGAPAEERAALLREALGLVRGPPLADLAYEPFAHGEVGRLEELELNAREELVDAELELGRHAEVVPELEALIAAHPYRERPRAQLMLALYRSGRQAEALEAFQAARRLLVDELGLEPSGELQELERAILRQDESLRAPPRVEPSPAVEATIPPPAVRATRKTVTIAVFEPATELAERLDPELARAVLDRCLAGVRAAVRQHGGSVAETADAAVVSVFGVPAAHEDDALRAVRATVEARAAVAGLNDELPAGRGAFLETRAGISTGEVLVAGSALPTGRPVGHARTLAREARAGEIVLDASTQTLLRDTVELEGRPDGSFRVVGMPATADARSLRLDAPLVGRRRQLAALLAAFEAAEEEGSCQLFSVLGIAGVGKSRLVGELLTELDGRAHVRRGRCLSYGEAITYLPLQEALPDADVDWAAPKDVLARRLREELETLARERPLTLALDDLQWAEPGLLDLLEDIGATSRGVPLLLVCAARPELLDDRPTWGGGVANASSLLLEPLPEADTERLLDLLLGASDLPDPVRTYIVAASEGNPLFLEELLASLVEAEVLQRRSGRWTTTEIAIPVPAGITALIAARIDRLPQDDRHLLELASVEGVVFSRDVLAEVVPDALRPDLAVRLDSLVRRELVRPIGGGGFRFRHQLIRETAYSALTKHDRGDLHERLAGVLEAEAAAPELVAYHREEAVRYRAELALD